MREGMMFEVGSRCRWRHTGPANSLDGFDSHTLHHRSGPIGPIAIGRIGPIGRIAEMD